MRTAGLIGCVAAAMSLGGCAAALIPIAASGAIGGRTLHHRRATPPVQGATPIDISDDPLPATTAAAPAPAAAVAAAAPPVAPPAAAAGATAPDEPTPGPQATAMWGSLFDYLTLHSDPSSDSVLIAQHGASGPQRRIACGSKPRAVIIDPAVNPDGSGDSYIDVLRTLGFAIVFTSPRPQETDPYFAHATKPSHQLQRGDAFVQLTPGAEGVARAKVAARYCVAAIVGRSAADFPDGVLPGKPGALEGWFLLPPS